MRKFLSIISGFFFTAACQGGALTHDNGGEQQAAPAAQANPTTTGQQAAPTCSCAIKSPGVYCQVEGGGANLHCEAFTGGCDSAGACKSDPGASKSSVCPTGQVWQGATSWAPAANVFACAESKTAAASPTTTVETACKATSQCQKGLKFCRCAGEIGGQSLSCITQTGECAKDVIGEFCVASAESAESCGSNMACKTQGWLPLDEACVPQWKPAGTTGCKANGCPAGQTCGSDDKCFALAPPTVGTGICEIKTLSGLGFTAYGSGVSSVDGAEAGWSAGVVAPANGSAKLSVGSASYLAFNAQLSTGLWAYGWDGVSASNATKVVDNWQVSCGGISYVKLFEGPQQPNCAANLAIGNACYWAKPNTTGTYRVVVRVK